MKTALFKKHLNPVFVETGTFKGDGVNAALKAGFDNIISLDIADCPYPVSQKVKLRVGDSSKALFEIVKDIDSKITFFLDAHLNDPALGRGSRRCPVLEELEQIGRHSIKNHTILIDDVRLFDTIFFDYITIKQVKKAILRINDNYVFSYATIRLKHKNDVLVAEVK